MRVKRMTKDWTGGNASIFKSLLGASNHTETDRETHDYYATSPEAAEWLLRIEPEISNIWECFCGEGHLAKVFNNEGKLGAASDLIDRGYYPEGVFHKYPLDFFQFNKVWKGDIVSNPPYKYALESVRHALELVNDGRYVAMFMKITFLEGKNRKNFFKEYPPIRVHVSSSRIPCAINGEFETPKKDKGGNIVLDKEGNPILVKGSSAACYAWFVWQKGFKGYPEIRWFN